MPGPFRVVCTVCKAGFRTQKVKPGEMPKCPKCRGDIVLLGETTLVCDACGNRTTQKGPVPLSNPIPCPKCQKPMRADAPDEGQDALSVTPLTLADSSEAATVVVGRKADKSAPPGQEEPATATSDSATVVTGAGAGGLELQIKPAGRRPPRKTKYGKYVIQSEIARGGMGIVYKAFDPDIQRTVALKVLIAGEGADVVAVSRFLREARAAGSLRHPNIVTIYDVGEEDGQTYFTMEYVEGKNLADIAKGGGVPLKEMIGYVRDVCKALASVHHRGIVHRDLKPENIMVDKDRRPLVMDFGLAKDVSAGSILSMTGAMLGTPSYMSPEQAQGNVSKIDQRTDIYSIGVILYELGTGRRPFQGNTIFDTIEAVVHDEAPSPVSLSSEVDKDLSTIIMKCIEKAPEARYQTMETLVDDLQRYLDGEPIQARPVSAPMLMWRRLKKNTTPLVAVTSIAVTMVVALVVYLLFAGSGGLEMLKHEVDSGDPERMASALGTLDSQFAEKKLKSQSDVEGGLAIARQVIGCKSEKAETLGLNIIARQKDVQAVPLIARAASEKGYSAERRARLVATLGKFDPEKVGDKTAVADALSAMAVDGKEDVSLRVAAAEGLGVFWTAQSQKTLDDVARDASCATKVRLAAIEGLGKHVFFGSPLMVTLVTLRGDDDERIVSAAEKALVRIRTRDIVASLYGFKTPVAGAVEKVGQIQELNAKRTREMEEVMGVEQPKPEAEQPKLVDLMTGKLSDPDAAVRMEAAFDLGNLGDGSAMPALVKVLADSDNGVRRSAARSLIQLSRVVKDQRVDMGEVMRLLRHEDPLVRENAAFLIGGLEAKETAPALVEALEKEDSPRAIRTMVRALADIRSADGLPAISHALERSKGETAQACVRAMIPFGRDAVPQLIDALSSTSKETRAEAVSALREVTGEDYGEDAAKWRSWLARPAR